MWDGDTALRLIEASERSHSQGLPELYFSDASYAVTDIRFAMAERQFAKARATLDSSAAPGRARADDDLYHALDLYWQAATYVQGTSHPGWLRRIGLRYLSAADLLDTADPVHPDHARRLAWFKTVLPRLNAIALGESD